MKPFDPEPTTPPRRFDWIDVLAGVVAVGCAAVVFWRNAL